jgi:ferredoxin-NADP reductase
MATIQATITSRKSLTHDTIELVLSVNEPVAFQPGQYIMLKVPKEQGFQFRSYSVANHPSDSGKNIYRLVIKLLPKGLGSEFLRNKKAGETLEILPPRGFFTFKSEGVKNIYLIATGTGIVPLLSIVENSLYDSKLETRNSKFEIYWGNRFKVDIFWQDYLDELKAKQDNFNYTLTLSKAVGYWQGAKGYVTDLLKQNELDWSAGHFYLCGLPQMVEDVKNYLISKDVSTDRIFEEKYISVGKNIATLENSF